jgi:hypothetical protein
MFLFLLIDYLTTLLHDVVYRRGSQPGAREHHGALFISDSAL